MSRCIIHVGMRKTGTTSIQRSLHHFSDDRFVYADIDGHPNHTRAIFNLLGVKHANTRPLKDSEKSACIAQFRRSMARTGDRTYIISGEGLVFLASAKLAELKSHLAQHFEDITVMAAVRAPASFMSSIFQQRLKRLRRERLDPLCQYHSYREAFEKFDEVFGRAHVQFWRFDPSTYPGGCAVRDFCHRLCIALPEKSIKRVNESLSREAIGLLYTYRMLGKEAGSLTMSGRENARLEHELSSIGRTRFRFSPRLTNEVLKANRADIDWMEARLGETLHEEMDPERPGDVSNEQDLLKPDRQAVRELLAKLDRGAPEGNKGESAEEVSRLVQALRELRNGRTHRLISYAKSVFSRGRPTLR